METWRIRIVSIPLTRRDCLTTLGAGLAVASLAPSQASAEVRLAAEPFGYCLNTSTISGQKLSLVDEGGIAAKAGEQSALEDMALADFAAAEGIALDKPVVTEASSPSTGSSDTTKTMGPAQSE